jgi:hypothetical protein
MGIVQLDTIETRLLRPRGSFGEQLGQCFRESRDVFQIHIGHSLAIAVLEGFELAS